MKYMVASDIHGSFFYASKLFERLDAETPDKLLILGDILYHGPRNDLPLGYAPKKVIELLNPKRDMIAAVRGNCEAEVDAMVLDFPCMEDFAKVYLNGRTLFMTHGHIYSHEKMPQLAKGDIFMYGHTHVKVLEEKNGIYILNPGSVSIPKDGISGYAIIEENAIYLKDLNGDVISKLDI